MASGSTSKQLIDKEERYDVNDCNNEDTNMNVYNSNDFMGALAKIASTKAIDSLIDILLKIINNPNESKITLDLQTVLQTLDNSKPALELLFAVGFETKTNNDLNNDEKKTETLQICCDNSDKLEFLKYVYYELYYKKSQGSLVFRESFNCYELIQNFPPKYINDTKKEIFKLIGPQKQDDCKGTLVFSEYDLLSLPETIPDPKTFIFQNKLIIQPNIYEYSSNDKDQTAMHFYVNFADQNLFGYYRSSLFAQDEIMTVEHPILCSLKEKILSSKYHDKNSKLSDDCKASFIILNAIKHGHFAENHLNKIYGNKFGMNALEYINICQPPIYDNIICIASEMGSMSKYTKNEILAILNKAYCGFFGAKSEALYESLVKMRKSGKEIDMNDEKKMDINNNGKEIKKVIVHTGNWGCGAFGGNIEVHAMLQIVSAIASDVDILYYHAVREQSMKKVQNACKVLLSDLYPKCKNKNGEMVTKLFIEELYKMGYLWGQPNGT